MARNTVAGLGRRSILAVLLLVPALLAACSNSVASPSATAPASVSAIPSASAPSPTASTPVSTPSASPLPSPSKGPASATFTTTGSNGLSGAIKISRISCGLPSFDGAQITALGTFASGPDFVLFVSASHLEARVGTGAAATLKLRSFVGSGVTSFDGSSGATLDSDLTETTSAGTAVGTLGALSHITGTLDCGNQQPGLANITVSGTSGAGQLSGALTLAHVQCTLVGSDTHVTTQGLGLAGSTPAIIFVNTSPGLLQVVLEAKGATAAEIYETKLPGAFMLTANGIQISADVNNNTPAGASPAPSPVLTLHVEGTATCGTIVQQ